jgi:uncharacterized protein
VSERLVRAVAWRRSDVVGTEVCRLLEKDGDWQLDGRAAVLLGTDLVDAGYDVKLDRSFATRTAMVRGVVDGEWRSVHLAAADGRWRLASFAVRPDRTELPARPEGDPAVHVPELDGCIDVDIGFTPSTNTLPIRRLRLDVGRSADVDAAWVRFPELTVERLPQRYTRLAENRYRYESRDGDFTAELVVDDAGLVMTYEGLWERVGLVTG